MIQEDKIQVAVVGGKPIYYNVPKSTEARPIETINYGMHLTAQYWRRQTDYPQFFFDYDPHLKDRQLCRINASRTEYRNGKLISLSVEDTIELNRLVKRESDRIKYGIYIWINGVRQYFPGAYYFALQWGKMFGVKDNNGYGEHRRYQRDYTAARELAIEETALEGIYVHKIKKSGISQLEALCILKGCISNKQFTSAIMSKNHETAKKANFKYFLYAFKNLPHVIRPFVEQKGWGNAVQKLEVKSSEPEYNYENTIAAVPTTPDGLDGLPPIQIIHIDEPPKIPDIEEVYTKSKEQTRIQQNKIGIIVMTSYPPETDTKAFYWCKNFFQKGCEVAGADGWPSNRMLPIFIGVQVATKGTHNIYGEPDEMLALRMEQAARDECDTPHKLQARKRQYPISAREGWESGGSGTTFNNIALSEQELVLEDDYKVGVLNYRLANLEWTAGRFSPVSCDFLSHDEIMGGKKKGVWKIYCTEDYITKSGNTCFKMPMKAKIINVDNRKEKRFFLQPPDDQFNSAGIDPVDYAFISETTDKRSENAAIIKDIEGNTLAIFHHRSEDPDDDLEEFIKGMILFGVRALVEGNRKNAVTTLEKEGMYYFMLIRYPDGVIRPYGQRVVIKHISSGKDLKSKYIELIMKKIKHRIYQFCNIDVIKQLKEFDPLHTQEFDLAVAEGLSEVSVDSLQSWLIEKQSKRDQYADMQYAMQKVMGMSAN